MMKRLVSVVASVGFFASAVQGQNLFAIERGVNLGMRFDHVTGQYMGAFGAGFWSSANGADIGPDGYLYVAVSSPVEQILRFDPYTGQYAGAVGAGFGLPVDIAFGPDGLMYVATFVGSSAQINRFEPVTGQYRGSFGSGFLTVSFANGTWLAFDGPTLIATDDAVNGYMKFDGATGQYLGAFGSGFVQNPWGITVYAPGRIAVLDQNPAQVVRFDATNNQYLGVFAQQGWLNFPSAITTLTDGKVGVASRLVATSLLGHAILRFDPVTGKYEGHFGFGFIGQIVGGLVAARPATVTGTIELQSWDFGTPNDFDVTFEIRRPGETTPLETVVARPNTAGQFSFQCFSRGTVDVTAKSPRHLRDKEINVQIDRVGASGLSFSLPPADATDDNTVNIDDFLVMASTYDTSPPTDIRADFNGDGQVDIDDFLIMANNYEASGSP